MILQKKKLMYNLTVNIDHWHCWTTASSYV